jgi:hypothetical protein
MRARQDVRISRFRLSDKTSRLHPRHVAPARGQAYEPEVPVEVREWISPAALRSRCKQHCADSGKAPTAYQRRGQRGAMLRAAKQ